MKIDRKSILNTMLETLRDISNKEYQRRVWIRGEGPEVDDFDEVVNYFFDEADGIVKHYRDFGITERQCKMLKNFRDKFEHFSDDNNYPELFIDTPEWDKIIRMAQEVLEAFDQNDSKNSTSSK